MLKIEEIKIPGYEKVLKGEDLEVGLSAYIAIHSTALGPAMGGVRIFTYNDSKEALEDALRLAQAMTYKSALAENGLGGGKSVIIANPRKSKTEKLLLSFAAFVDSLQGKYIAAEDVGSTTEDMKIIRKGTKYVAALPTDKSSGDPSRFTAWGVFQGMRAVAQKLWKTNSLRGKRVAIQGLGNVGSKLARFLFWDGAELILSDINPEILHHYVIRYGAEQVEPEKFSSTKCDILAPCAMGCFVCDESLPLLNCKAIAGSANNQLTAPQHGIELSQRKILYAPDFVINAGGIINAAAEFDPVGYDPKTARDRVNHIYDTLLAIFAKSEKEHKSTDQVADEMAEYNLKHLIGKRTRSINFE